ncbi:hypothetical protein [uncultured Shewanella sp.]|uniref:hypothetical protein n=1 Tax=uncultured Shewanella sp. TaxID=173975 RepID=UPI00260DBBB3|nr:hypothetical protein [uncultured Shewanella sp.]
MNKVPLNDTFDKLVALSIEKMAAEEQAHQPYKNTVHIKAQLQQKMTDFMLQTQTRLDHSIKLCQTFLSQEQIQRIFLPILRAFNHSPQTLEQREIPNAKVNNDDYELILAIGEQLTQQQTFHDAIAIYSLLELIKPEDIRAYLQHGRALEAQGDIATTTQYYQNMTQALNNPVLNFHAAQYLLNIGQAFEATEKINNAIEALNSVNTDSPECVELMAMLQAFKNAHQLN